MCMRSPVEHGVGGATDMGSGYQCRPPQDCVKIQIQSRPQRGVYPLSIANTCHGESRARQKKRKGAGIIGGHGQSGDDQFSTVGAETAGSPTISIGKRRGECTRLHDHRQKNLWTTKGTAQTKIKRKATQSPLPLPIHSSITISPPRDEKEPHPAGHAAAQVGDGTKTKKRRKI